MRYAIKRSEDGKYVAQVGSERAYTSDIEKACTYVARPAAERDCCGNEFVVALVPVTWG